MYTCRRTLSTDMKNVTIIEKLETFGLTPIEAKIYLHLLNKQSKTILELGRELGIPRTSVYDNALKLSEKGLIEKIVTHKSQKLQAYPLKILQSYIDKEKVKVEKLQETFEQLETSLMHIPLLATATEVRYYHGKQGFQQMMFNALSAEKETFGYSHFGRIEVVGEKFARWHFEEMIKRDIKDRVIINPKKDVLKFLTGSDDPLSKYRHAFQETRAIDGLYIAGDTTIYNNIFGVCYWRQGEIVGVEIENGELVKTQKSIFEEMWKIAKPIEKYIF